MLYIAQKQFSFLSSLNLDKENSLFSALEIKDHLINSGTLNSI